tara:strand:- start:227 stop:658 length:432 start_codon:yes stop_codon:yes gene_type:complete
MNKYYVNVENNTYYVLNTNDGRAYPFILNAKCGPEISNFSGYATSQVDLEECLLVSYAQLVVITASMEYLRVAKEAAEQAAKQAAKEAVRTSTPEYRLKLALTCLLAYVRDYSDDYAAYDDLNDLSIDLGEIQVICDGIEVEL